MKIKFLILPLLLFLVSCSEQSVNIVHTINGNTMGTTFSVKFIGKENSDIAEIDEQINTLLKTVNQQMSTYIPDSELSLFNKSNSNKWMNISADLAKVINVAQNMSIQSNGLFDITIGPLVNLWGFGPDNKPQTIPTDSDIKILRNYVGYKNVAVRLTPPSVRKFNSNVYCDLSAIAKGFGVDKISEYLISKGFANHLVEIGGELRANGNKFNDDWKVGISTPSQSKQIQEIIKLNNLAMATSGDYWNYFEENGVRYSHTINPLTGKPITHTLASVTVIAKTCMEADALATAIDVMGPELGLKFAEDNELYVYLIVKDKNNFKILYTKQFSSLLAKGNLE